MKKLVWLLIFFASYSRADVFQIAGRTYSFEVKGSVLVHGCKTECQALKAVRERKIAGEALAAIPKRTFKRSLGSTVCADIYRARSVIGKATNGDGRAFCLFPDESMIEMNSLSAFAKGQLTVDNSSSK